MFLSRWMIVLMAASNCRAADSIEGMQGTKPEISIGFIWENPRYELHNVDTVKVTPKHHDLRLTCVLHPALPKTKNNFFSRDNIVQWKKVSGVGKFKFSEVYWSDDQSITAVAFKVLKARHLGNYSCSFMSTEQVIHLKAESLQALSHLPQPENLEDYEGLVFNLQNKSGLNEIRLPQKVEGFKYQEQGVSFPCKVESQIVRPEATSVHSLKAENVKVVAFIGGSIMSGVAADAEYVADLFRVTGNSIFRSDLKSDFLNFPDILKKFSPKAKLLRLQPQTDFSAYGMYLDKFSNQVDQLIATIRADKDISLKKDWKLITVSLDFDDVCYSCHEQNWSSKIGLVKNGLDRLASELPRTFVNLILPPNITALTSYHQLSNCSPLHRRKCPCMSETYSSKKTLIENMEAFSSGIIHLVEKSMRYNGKLDFVVVIQPLWSHEVIFTNEETQLVFSKDCYHLSSFGHQNLAITLWNNMFESVHDKKKVWQTTREIHCPLQDSPYFLTTVNSARVVSLDTSATESTTLPAVLRIGVGTLLGIVIVMVILGIIVYRNRRRVRVGPNIRVLEQPWKRTKKKI